MTAVPTKRPRRTMTTRVVRRRMLRAASRASNGRATIRMLTRTIPTTTADTAISGRAMPLGAPRLFDDCERLSAGLLGGDLRHEEEQLDVIRRGEDGKQVVRLKHEAHPAGAVSTLRVVIHPRQGDTLDPDVPGREVIEAGETVQKRC